MSLPGKLCIGILEEDNPQKAYFRFKPMLVEADGRYIPYAEAHSYPEEGCIRIVPDKNESNRFKARMRQMGLFCVVDLRAHPDDNDKIHPNKNYREGSPEQNAFIIYSDVVREPAPDAILEILPEADAGALRPAPRTPSVLLKGEALNPQRYRWIADPNDEIAGRLIPHGEPFAPDDLQSFDLPGFHEDALSFAILPPDKVVPAPAQKPAAEKHPDEKPAPEKPAPEIKAAPEPPAPESAEKPPEKPEASEKPDKPDKPEKPEKAERRPAKAREDDKPWIHRDRSMLPPPVDPRLPPSQRSLAAQSGLNPRRSRSLQELIDEKWQHSRLNQLGQPVAPIHTGAPVASPVESVVSAVRDVWSQPNLRRDLLESLGGIEEFGASLEECREAARQADIERHLENLEARRLTLLGEVDHLTLQNAETRRALKDELRRDATGELAEAVRRVDAARAERDELVQQAQEARAAAQDARKAVDALTGEELERRLRDFTLDEHMLERLRLIKGEAEAVPAPEPALQTLTLNELAGRLEARFDAAGYALSHEDALNLCACAAVSPALLISGPVGSGKSDAARLLAEALGWTAIGRFVAFAPGKGSLEADPRVAALDRGPDAPAMLLLDDANLHPDPDPFRGLGAPGRPLWRLCLTVQDAGAPLPAYALDKGFMVRLAPPTDAPWQPRPTVAAPVPAPASLRLAVPDKPRPAVVEERMKALRETLAHCGAPLSRRALGDAWRYCALMLDALGDDADPIHILDLAVAQRLLPSLLASAPVATLRQLPALLDGLPAARALLRLPLPIQL